MVLVNDVPLLQTNFLRACACLRRDKLLEVANCIVRLAFHSHAPACEDERKSRKLVSGGVWYEKRSGLRSGRNEGSVYSPSLSLTTTSIIAESSLRIMNGCLDTRADSD